MPRAESQVIRSSEASRSIPSSNIKFRATETFDPSITKMVHSKETIDNLPKFIDLINKVAVPHLKTVCEDLKRGVQIEERNRKCAVFYEKMTSAHHYLELKMLNSGFANLKKNSSSDLQFINSKKAKGTALLYSFMNSKLMINKCSVFSNIKHIVEAEFSKTIRDKVFEPIKPKPSSSTESPMKSIRSSKVSKEKADIEEEFTEEKRDRLGHLLENLNNKCHYLEKVGEKTFNQWKFYSINKEKSNILLSYAVRNIVNKNLVRAFEKINLCRFFQKDESTVSKKMLSFSSVLHSINKKIWFEKFRVIAKMKTSQSPFRYVQQLSKMVATLKTVLQRRLVSGVDAIKSVQTVHKLRKMESMKRVAAIWSNLQKNNMKSLFLCLHRNVFLQKYQKLNLTNRLKGRVLLGCSKQAPLFSLKSAFLKFRVRSDSVLVKKAIDRFPFFFLEK